MEGERPLRKGLAMQRQGGVSVRLTHYSSGPSTSHESYGICGRKVGWN